MSGLGVKARCTHRAIRDDAFAVFLHEVDDAKLDADLLGHGGGRLRCPAATGTRR